MTEQVRAGTLRKELNQYIILYMSTYLKENYNSARELKNEIVIGT